MKINPKKLYKVFWDDITNILNLDIKEPYNKYITPCWSIGYVKEDKNVVLVLNSWNKDEEWCGDAIPKGCVTKITCIE